MRSPLATYRKVLGGLGVIFLSTQLIVAFVFKTDPFAQWSVVGTLYSVFFAPALAGAFVIHAWARPQPKELGLTACLGVALAALHLGIGRYLPMNAQTHATIASHLFFGLGAASLLIAGVRAARTNESEREAWLSILLPGALLPAFVGVSTFFLGMTAFLHPLVYDASVFVADAPFGWQPSFAFGRLFAEFPSLAGLCRIVYWNLPLALALVYAARHKQDRVASADVLLSFIALGVAGFLLYHLYPIVGPAYFYSKYFPAALPPSIDPSQGHPFAIPIPRNCMPSLHTAWAIMLYWHARPLGRAFRLAAAAWLLLTILGTLGFGYHYALDLVAAVPFTLAIRAAFGRAPNRLERKRWGLVAFGSSMTIFWIILLRFFPPSGMAGVNARWVLALATVTSSVVAERWIHRQRAASSSLLSEGAASGRIENRSHGRAELGIAAVFFVSGFSGLVYEVVFAKSLALTFGSTATASTTVLATYMGGISLGAWIGGEVGERRSDPLRIYALCEVAIALYCAATPWLFSGLRQVYVGLVSGIDPGRPILVVVQAALGALVLLPPTTLMGITMPVLAKQFAARADLGRAIGLLYGANTLGAAFGAWSTGYVVLSFLGVTGTTWLAVLANLCVGLMALRLATRLRSDATTDALPAAPPSSSAGTAAASSSSHRVIALVFLGVGGFVTLALETTDIHLLAVVAGNSAYAFSLMLFAFLVGLGLGAALARRLLQLGPATLLQLGLVELALAATILASVHGWEEIPAYFASFAGFPLVRNFASRELVRFVVCSLMMIPPALCIGTLFPLAMDMVTRGADNPVRSTGRASALNTVGNIAGAIAGGFVLVPRIGSLPALELLAACALALGLLPLVRVEKRARWQLSSAATVVLALFVTEPKDFDYERLAGGANVYFQPFWYGHVIAHAESLDGGLTTVNETSTVTGARMLTLLTNGKFQGDTADEMKAQYGCALYPLLHTARRDEALVIGLGTGVSAATTRWAGFRHVDVAELSKDIVDLTDVHFADVTGRVLHQPDVDLHVTDGRNFLLLSKKSYDLISMEISSIWFAGAASLYNREFYELVKGRLRPDGVLQQWVQLHRVGGEDLVSILGTVRSEFPYVWLYFSGTQGVIVACTHHCEPTSATIARIETAPELRGPLSSLEGGLARLLRDRLLSPESVDRFLADVASRGLVTDQLVSTDDNLFLEYNTPRGNVRDYESSLKSNIALLGSFSPKSPIAETQLTERELEKMRREPQTEPEESPGLTRDVRHGKTEP